MRDAMRVRKTTVEKSISAPDMCINFTDLIAFEKRLRNAQSHTNYVVPRFVFSSFQYIMRHPIEGEFRVCPNEDQLKQAKDHLEQSPETGVPLKGTLLTCALLKYFFRISKPRLTTR